MCDTLKQMIERKRFKSLADAERKLVTYHAVDLITDDEFAELLTIVKEIYGNTAD